MVAWKIVIATICFMKCVSAANMSGHIEGGQNSSIWEFPHSAFLYVEHSGDRNSFCGSSILNQAIILTAAHCVRDDCNYYIFVGSEQRKSGFKSKISNITVHERYDHSEFRNDIALMRLEHELVFGKNVRRVILMRDPPYGEEAFVAGWGRISRVEPSSIHLKHVIQRVYRRKKCYKIGMQKNLVPKGAICGEHPLKLGTVGKGDSGSALVASNIPIQLGIVSFKHPTISLTITIYTDTGYFYDWIKEKSEELFCNRKPQIFVCPK